MKKIGNLIPAILVLAMLSCTSPTYQVKLGDLTYNCHTEKYGNQISGGSTTTCNLER